MLMKIKCTKLKSVKDVEEQAALQLYLQSVYGGMCLTSLLL